MQIFTLGYEKLKPAEYVLQLQNAGVGVVLDVRETAWSYNRPYCRTAFSEFLATANISYKHLKECGNPSSNRKTATSISECLERYQDYLLANPECLKTLFNEIESASAGGRPACLTCYERMPEDCHRNILLDVLSEYAPDLEIIHLQGTIALAKTVAPRLSWDTTVPQS